MISILPTSGNHHSTLALQFIFVFMYLSLCNMEDLGSIPGLGWSPGEGKVYLLQYSGPENSMNCIVHGVTKSWTRLSDFHFHFLYLWASPVAQMVKNLPAMQKTWVQSLGQKDPLEKGMAIHSSILAWRIPWTEKSGGLQSWGCKESDATERLNTSTYTLS